jgi:hypothetical protein
MSGEQYLSSAIKLLQRTGTPGQMGPCDPHVGNDTLGYVYMYPAAMRIPSDQSMSDFYRANVTVLGGCLGGTPSASQPGLGALFQEVGIGNALCDAKAVLTPTGFDGSDTSPANVARATGFLFHQLLLRDPSPAEASAADALASTCLADKTGCGTMQAYAQTLCGTILRSAPYTYY